MNPLDAVFYKIPTQATITEAALKIAHDDTEWVKYYNFIAKPIPQELLLQEPFFKKLAERYEFHAGVLRTDPYSVYDWHVDTRRGAGINMQLNFDGFSMCLFSTNENLVTRPIFPVQYTPNEYYLFNTQQLHTVINFDHPRYMLSVEFKKDKDELTYEELYNYIKDEE